MRFSVDPWDPSYGTSDEGERGESTADVEAGVEVAAERWRPIGIDRSVVAPPAVLFVDGVRRVDAQVWVDDGADGAAPGLCASYAAGVVCCCDNEGGHMVESIVRHGVFTTAVDAEDIATPAGRYAAHVTAARPDIAPMQLLSLALQRDLAESELVAAGRARERAEDLLVVDGPLHGREKLPRTIGFIKTHRSEYLQPPLRTVVGQLAAGERTPVFRIAGSWERYSWYLRLPCPPGSPWAGVVRIECSADLPVEGAILLASVSQATLPRFASTAYKDSRAPQNLYPIGGLERELRRRLGDQRLCYRGLRRAATSY
ncbi:DNA double-strand break repair nuclease NurA [Pseudonocardia sp. H11422]|uniref:DNA double-strand break repair nuclease NurA n=1 Tax=Pseudonocardia sp. H11422 TaxID=2835866 RepID=UPI001BDC921B|nr:DNA double-strand break repair nuclease NurA [Pseudonocardia sp. H11422]